MLFPAAHLDGIAAGRVDLAFRRWRAPRVKSGSRLRTRIGVLAVGAVEVIAPASISDADARRAGHPDRAALLTALARREGEVYRIELRLDGPDPRVALRSRSALSDTERSELAQRLARLDEASRHGPWTAATLALIAAHPETRAVDLAALVGREKLPFKRDVRKLKELGLTESLERGYRLSARGRAWLDVR
jgi:hypothetical protein